MSENVEAAVTDAPASAEAPVAKPRRSRKTKADTPATESAAVDAVAAKDAVEVKDAPAAKDAAEAPKKRPRKTKAAAAAKAAAAESPIADAGESTPASAPVESAAAEPAAIVRETVAPVVAESASDASAAIADESSSERTGARPRRSRKVSGKDAPREAVKEVDGSVDGGAEKGDKPEKYDKAEKAEKPAGDSPKVEKRKNRQNGKQGQQQSGSKQSQQSNGKQNQQNQQRNERNERNERHQRRQRQNQQREILPSVNKEELAELKVADLRAKAAELGIDGTGVKKPELVDLVFDAAVKAEGFIEVEGVLDIMPDGYGFLRTQGYLPGEHDCYVGLSLIRRSGLRKGDMVRGQTRPARENEKYAAIQKIISVNDIPVEELGVRPKFADLTPVYPDDRLWMEHGKNTITARVIDLAAPIGKGQRGLIVSPPKAGKTTILKDIAASISANNPDVHLMCLLVDERPEEVTDMQRSVHGEVISSTFDMPAENHIAVSELVIERAKRLVEGGKDVVILLDSITRLARAYNLAQPASGRILSGGVDSTALYPPKRFLGAARNIEGGGSLTILASALIDTGSKMDEVIFEEFKGTGNMELKLDRNLADRRIFPAIDPITSGTRKEELLLDPQEAPLIWAVRRILANMNNTERAMDMLIKSLKQTNTNQEFLIRTAKKAQGHSGKSDEIEL